MKRATRSPALTTEQVLEASKLTNAEARFLVSDYYEMQHLRQRTDMQVRHMGDKAEVVAPDGSQVVPSVLRMTAENCANSEKAVAKALQKFCEGREVGRWMLAQYGVGPVISAGLLAHLDITRAPTAGHFWSFAGQNPNMKWEKGQKRPFNPHLKQLVYHLGECFKRSSNGADSFYGAIYRKRKAFLVERNERGYNAERAKTFVTKSAEWKKELEQGKLPTGNLDRQAANYAAKLFLSHLHGVMYWDHFGRVPPKPFAIDIMGHAHEVKIPHADLFPGFAEAYYGAPIQQAA